MPDNAVFDRQLLALRRARAHKRGAETFLLDHVAHDLAERLSVVLRKFEVAADIGTPGDAVRNLLVERQARGARHRRRSGVDRAA